MPALEPEARRLYDPTVRCPTCKKSSAAADSRLRPFCSPRCKMIDLGRWLDGDYAVAGEPATDEELAADVRADPARDPRKP